jgi:shikimate kinase
MSVVTLAHAAYSGGSAIAEKVASVLNYRSVDREVLIEASKRYGIPEAKYTEVLEAEGHWWERWRESLRLYRITLQAAMCEVAEEGQVVYYGRAGRQLLPGIGHVLNVLVVAPIEYRIEQVRAQKTRGNICENSTACAAAGFARCSMRTGWILLGKILF